jgi:hypothetical protein
MHLLSVTSGAGLTFVAAQHAPTGWACLGWTGGATAVPIPPAWEPGPDLRRLAARVANRANARDRLPARLRSTGSRGHD